mmetsp:Transcript_22684/g.27406  ORF Transcript_22684/g.27406 Transcript_22684/m.27406 type:complete len:525 (-) Transcript_22684:269-1843(-)
MSKSKDNREHGLIVDEDVPEETVSKCEEDDGRTLNVTQLVGITFFAACGGPFGFEESVGAGGGTTALFAVTVVPFIWSVPLALMTAELACMMPDMGGHIIWVDRAFGSFWGILNGQLSVCTNAFDNALYPVMFVDYLEGAVVATTGKGFSLAAEITIRFAIMILVTVINIKGADIVGDATMLFGGIVLAPFIVMMAMGLPQVLTQWSVLEDDEESMKTHNWGVFLMIILWNTCGFDNAGACAGEVKDPGRTYPRALGICVLLVVLTYAGPVVVGINAIPNSSQWKDGTFVEVGQEIGGVWLANFLGFSGIASSLGLLCTLLCTSARMLAGMAQIGCMPKCVGKLHHKYNTPHIAVILSSVSTLGLTLLPFASLAQIDMVFYSLSTILKFLALIHLRNTEPDTPRPYRIPFDGTLLWAHFFPAIALCLVSISLCTSFTLVVSSVLLVIAIISSAVIAHRRRISSELEAAEAWVQIDDEDTSTLSLPISKAAPVSSPDLTAEYELVDLANDSRNSSEVGVPEPGVI